MGMFSSMFGAPGSFDSDEEMFQAGSSSADPFAAFGMGGGARHDPFAQQQQQPHQYHHHRQQQQQYPMRGPRQQEVPLNVKLEDLYTGASKRLNITRHVADAASGQKLPIQEQIVVNITPGWKEGTRLTYQGLGDEEVGHPAADLVITIKQLPHSRFERKGNDLYTTVKVPLVTALAGGNFTVQQLDGRQLQIPIQQLLQPRTERVLPGEGMPTSKQPGRKGDLHVIMEVEFPKNLSQKQKETLRHILPAA
jgi:DnaJ-class molecular chaperone